MYTHTNAFTCSYVNVNLNSNTLDMTKTTSQSLIYRSSNINQQAALNKGGLSGRNKEMMIVETSIKLWNKHILAILETKEKWVNLSGFKYLTDKH